MFLVSDASAAASPLRLTVFGSRDKFQPDGQRLAAARCPDGFNVVGAEAIVDDVVAAQLTELFYADDAKTVLAVARPLNPKDSDVPWRVTVTAICSSAFADVQIVAASGQTQQDGVIESAATCPAGKLLIGAGYRGNARVTSLASFAGSTLVGRARIDPSIPGTRFFAPFAVCASGGSVRKANGTSTASAAAKRKTSTATCGAAGDQWALSGGFEITDTAAATASAYVSGLTLDNGFHVRADKPTKSSQRWTVSSWVFCAT